MHCLPDRVAAAACAAPDRIAFVDGERRIGYGELWRQCHAFASALRARGLGRGDRVAVLLPNRIEAAVAVYGCWLAGGIAVPLNAQARARDFEPWLRHSGASHLVHEAGNADVLAALTALDVPPVTWALQPHQPIPYTVADDPHDPGVGQAGKIQSAMPALILYTSGTTGAPKGVTLSHGNLLANAQAVVDYLALEAGDSVLGLLPFYYAYGASVLHTHLLAGARLVLAPNLLFPHLLMELVARERITGLSGVPSTFALLLDRVELSGYDLSSLRYLTQAGGAMSQALTRRLRAALPGPKLFVMYGQTEATSRLTWLPPERLDDKAGSVGIPLDGVSLRIVREDGDEAPAGVEGEVHVRGPNVMQGYWNAPEATAAVLRDGWLRTGDLGRLDADGFLYLAGRRSDMIKTGAHRVHPSDIEEVIAEVAGVVDSAVVGIDDDTLGQVVKAFVVMDPPPREDTVGRTDMAIRAHCRARLAPYKIPRHIEFVDALPRTASGKVRRFALSQPQATAA
jgi:long-chain acyl-CoA synthetase